MLLTLCVSTHTQGERKSSAQGPYNGYKGRRWSDSHFTHREEHNRNTNCKPSSAQWVL